MGNVSMLIIGDTCTHTYACDVSVHNNEFKKKYYAHLLVYYNIRTQ